MSGLLKSISSIAIAFFLLILIPVMVFAESNQTAIVAAEVLNLRQNPTVSAMQKGTINLVNASVLGAAKISKISAGTINVLSESTIFAIRTGTISVISVNPGRADTTGLNPADAGDTGTGPAGSSPDDIGPNMDELIRFAKSLLGIPYVYGGMSPAGFDCSGFTSYVFGAFGIRLERVSTDQAKQGMEISKENLKPGDLVFFDTNGGHSDINHTGIFIGDGKFIHASSGTSSCVIISDLTTGYYTGNFMTARRIYRAP